MISNARRLSSGSGRSTVVLDSMNSCLAQMQTIATRLAANVEGVEKENIIKWCQQMETLSQKAVTEKAKKTTAEAVAQQVLAAHAQGLSASSDRGSANSSSSSGSSSGASSDRADLENEDTTVLNEVKGKTIAAMRLFDVRRDERVQQLQRVLDQAQGRISSSSSSSGEGETGGSDDDEIEMVDTGFAESDMACPFTSQPYKFKANMPLGK